VVGDLVVPVVVAEDAPVGARELPGDLREADLVERLVVVAVVAVGDDEGGRVAVPFGLRGGPR
jgi:hypothetical protein